MENKLILKIFIFTIALNFGIVRAQQFNPGYLEYHDKYVPPTPNASNFTIYGDTPVNHATGLPQINIPIFTIEEDGISVPISISYHASGVKVDDLASVVGLKWTLNAGGGIFRQVNDKIDEEGWLNANQRGIVNPTWLASQGPIGTYQTQQLIHDSSFYDDYHPDDFNYNFLGNSGAFIFNLNGLVENEHASTMKISKLNNGPGNLFDFLGQDGSGNTFHFEDIYELNNKNVASSSITAGSLSFNSDTNRSGWMLKEIVTRNGKSINFGYSSYNFSYTINDASHTIAYAPGCGVNNNSHQCGCIGDGSGNVTDVSNTTIIYNPTNQLISTIATEKVLVTFNYSDDNTLATWKKRLDSITILDLIDNETKSFVFTYGKFSGDPRLRLDQIQEFGFDGSSNPPYKFYYESGSLPAKGSKSKDYHGYYNGKNNITLVPFSTVAYNTLNSTYRTWLADRSEEESYLKRGVLNKIEYPTSGTTEFIYEPNAVPATSGANPTYSSKSSSVSTQVYTYTNISGAYTIFQTPFSISSNLLGGLGTPVNYGGSSDICSYDPQNPNIDCSQFNIYPRSGPFVNGPGIFSPNKTVWAEGSVNLQSGDYMLEIIVETADLNANPNALIQVSLDWVEEDPFEEQTFYTGGLRLASKMDKNSDGSIAKKTNYNYDELTGYNLNVSNNNKSYGSKQVFSADNLALHPSLIKSGYFYKEVTINQIGEIFSNDTITTVERFEETFRNKSYEPQMVRQEMFKANNLVKSIKMDYENTIVKTEQYWILGDKDLCYPVLGLDDLGYNNPNSHNYFHRKNVLNKTTEVDYLSGPSEPFSCAITIKEFEYNSNLLPTKEELDGRYYALSQADVDNNNLSITNDGEYVAIDYTYPQNYSALANLTSNYLINYPVSKIVHKNGELVLGQFMEYDNVGNVIATYKHNRGQETNNSSATYIPSDYNLFASYMYVDGRPVEVQIDNGPPTTLLWDQYDTYLMAELQNISFSDVTSLSEFGSPPVLNSSGLTPAQETALRNISSGMVTTYAYDALNGLLYIKDPRENITNFTYDGLGRLEAVKDLNNKLISEYDYHYKGQQ
ncbi:hypothetical protein [uncultured Croceitalea sp.]|uniref:hypothetical protein n=1 Tax=uncultured Croceitalea sp. TaxID=1798908 RepID=UPI003305DC38